MRILFSLIMMTSTNRIFVSALIVVSLHGLAAWAINRSVLRLATPQVTETLVKAYVEPRVRSRKKTDLALDLSQLFILRQKPWLTLLVDMPRIDFEVSRNAAATVAAPSLDPEPSVDLYPYVVEAALLPGEGATVVLRIEVLEDGSAGQIAIDVSSGSNQVDLAAIDYARAHRWAAAMIAGAPHSMWIRWGVRLQA
jgi:TonB family protein